MGRFDRSHDRHRADMIDMIRNGSVDTTTLVHGSKKTKGKHDKGRSVRTDAHCDAMTLMESTPRSGRPITRNKTLSHLPRKMALSPTRGNRHPHTRPQRVRFKNRPARVPLLKSWGAGDGSVRGGRHGRRNMHFNKADEPSLAFALLTSAAAGARLIPSRRL